MQNVVSEFLYLGSSCSLIANVYIQKSDEKNKIKKNKKNKKK